MLLPVYSWTPLKHEGQFKIFFSQREDKIVIITADICPFPQSLRQPSTKQTAQALHSCRGKSVPPYNFAVQSTPDMLVAAADETPRAEQSLAVS